MYNLNVEEILMVDGGGDGGYNGQGGGGMTTGPGYGGQSNGNGSGNLGNSSAAGQGLGSGSCSNGVAGGMVGGMSGGVGGMREGTLVAVTCFGEKSERRGLISPPALFRLTRYLAMK